MKLSPFLRLQLTGHSVKLCTFLVQIGNTLFPFPSQLYHHHVPLLLLGRKMWDSIRSTRQEQGGLSSGPSYQENPETGQCPYGPRRYPKSSIAFDKASFPCQALKHHLDVQLMEHKQDESAKSPQTCQ